MRFRPPHYLKFLLIHIALQISSTAIIATYLENRWSKSEEQSLSDQLKARSRVFKVLLTRSGEQAVVDLIEASKGALGSDEVLTLLDGRGRRIDGSDVGYRIPVQGECDAVALPERDDRRFRICRFLLAPDRAVLVGAPLNSRSEARRDLLYALIGGLVLGADAAATSAWLQNRATVKRVNEVAAATMKVQRGELAERVARSFTDDPFDRLSSALNMMFERIEIMVSEMRAMTDALAHDLRSPMMRIQLHAEKIGEEALPGTSRRALERIFSETEDVTGLLSTAMDISRTEAGMGRDQFSVVDLSAIVDDVLDINTPAAEAVGVTLGSEVSGNPALLGHRQLLSQLISNLVENALKYAAEGGRVDVAVEEMAEDIRLSVRDRGPGIAVEEREVALRRFGRLDDARSTSGAGLGLSLVQAICRLHGGTLQLRDAGPGLEVETVFPKIQILG